MNFFKPLCAEDLPVFDLIPGALPGETIAPIYERIVQDLPPPTPGQSGQVLASMHHLAAYFERLREHISDRLRCYMYLRLDKSSYRTQEPVQEKSLALHQDYVALQERRKWLFGLRAYYSDPATEPSCTVWVPLCDVDEYTPTLEVCTRLPGSFLEHKGDAVGYSVVADSEPYKPPLWPMKEFSMLSAGTGVFLTALTLHRTCVRPHHTKTRRSFDLRFLTTPPPDWKGPSWNRSHSRRWS